MTRITINLADRDSFKKARQQIQAMKVGMGNVNQLSPRLKQRIAQRYVAPMMRELKRYPPTRDKDQKIEWTSDAQRKAVMAKLDGKPFKRTFKFKRGWKYEIVIESGRLKIRVWHTWENAKYVVGDLGQGVSESSVRRYTKPIQKFHTLTGWKPAYKPVQKYMGRLKQHVLDELQAEASGQ